MTTSDYLEQLVDDRDTLVTNLTTKGITGLTGDETFTELVPEVLNIPSGGGQVEAEEKDVNFYDYDGRCVYSYTQQEFLALTAMPENPTHDGLTSQGWNWSLADAKTFVTDYKELNIGQMYTPTDGKTKIFIHLEERLHPYMYIRVDGETYVDWGDGTTDTVTTLATWLNIDHQYSTGGSYTIKVWSNDTNIYFGGDTTICSKILWSGNTYAESRPYQNAINKIITNSYTQLTNNALRNCFSIEYVILGKGNVGQSVFNNSNIKYVTIPISTQTAMDSVFTSCKSLKKVSIPKNITDFAGGNFQNCEIIQKIIFSWVSMYNSSDCQGCLNLTYVHMNPSITYIPNMTFYNCSNLKFMDFSHHTTVVRLHSNYSIYGIPSDCQIIVPDSLYDNWVVADTWSTYASQIVKASEV